MKILRLGHAHKIKTAVSQMILMLEEFYPRKKILINNIKAIIQVSLVFILGNHFFACGWLLMIHYQGSLGPEKVEFGANMSSQYVNSIYQMTQTISTVGYGD
jgi:hypothetical protein